MLSKQMSTGNLNPLPRIVASEVLDQHQKTWNIVYGEKVIERDFEHPAWEDQYRTAILKTTDNKYQLWTYAELRRYSLLQTLLNPRYYDKTVCASTVWFLGDNATDHQIITTCVQSVVDLMLAIGKHTAWESFESPMITYVDTETYNKTYLVQKTISVDEFVSNYKDVLREEEKNGKEKGAPIIVHVDNKEHLTSNELPVEDIAVVEEVSDAESAFEFAEPKYNCKPSSKFINNNFVETLSNEYVSSSHDNKIKTTKASQSLNSDAPQQIHTNNIKNYIDCTRMLYSFAGIDTNEGISIRKLDSIAGVYFSNKFEGCTSTGVNMPYLHITNLGRRNKVLVEHNRSFDIQKDIVEVLDEKTGITTQYCVGNVANSDPFHAPYVLYKPVTDASTVSQTEIHAPYVLYKPDMSVTDASTVSQTKMHSTNSPNTTDVNAKASAYGTYVPEVIFIDTKGNIYAVSVTTIRLMQSLIYQITGGFAVVLPPTDSLFIDMNGYNHNSVFNESTDASMSSAGNLPLTYVNLDIFRMMSRFFRMKAIQAKQNIWFLDNIPTMEMNLELMRIDGFLGPIEWYRKWYVNDTEADHNELIRDGVTYIFLEFKATVDELEKYYDNVEDLTALLNMYRPQYTVTEEMQKAYPGKLSNVMTIVIYGREDSDISNIEWMRYDDVAYPLKGPSQVKYRVTTEYEAVPID